MATTRCAALCCFGARGLLWSARLTHANAAGVPCYVLFLSNTAHQHVVVHHSGSSYNSCRCDTPTGCCICAWVTCIVFFPIGALALCCHDAEYESIMHRGPTTTIVTMRE